MTPERWRRVKRILEEALARDPARRDAYLREVCADDDALRRDVESFLAAEPPAAFLQQPAVTRAPAVPDAAIDALPNWTEGPVDEVRPAELPPYTRLVVSTGSSRYELVIIAPLELGVLVKGGRRFPERTRAQLYRQESVRVGAELRLIVGTRKVVTSTIVRIEIQKEKA